MHVENIIAGSNIVETTSMFTSSLQYIERAPHTTYNMFPTCEFNSTSNILLNFEVGRYFREVYLVIGNEAALISKICNDLVNLLLSYVTKRPPNAFTKIDRFSERI